MKSLEKLIFTIFIILINFYAKEALADTNPSGELIFKPKNIYDLVQGSLYLISDYGWIPNPNGGYFVFDDHYISFSTAVRFGTPTSQNHAMGFVYWGKYEIYFTCVHNGIMKESSFTIDLRDERWITDANKYPSSPDTYFIFDFDNNNIEVAIRSESNIVQTIDIPGSLDLTIWDLWNAGPPVQNNFVPEVQMDIDNIVENTTHNKFGFLKIDDIPYPTTVRPQLNFSTHKGSEGTLEEYYDNKRNYSFKWTFEELDKQGSNPIYFKDLYFILNKTEENKLTRVFKPVYPLIIKNNLENTGISGGTILFKDPTTTNAFETKSAAGNGFILNEAFERLDEKINEVFSKYSVRALDNFEYNGKKS